MRAAFLVAALLLPSTATAQPSPAEQRIASWVESHREESIALLERLVKTNSGTMNHAGVRAVGDILRGELEPLGFRARWIEMPEGVDRAGHLFAEREGRPGAPRVLLIGHIDTVFELDHPFQRFVRSGERASGPGAVDMKSGDVTIVAALRALAAVDALDQLSITVALIGDEESAGLPIEASRGDLVEAGRRADVALGFESGNQSKGVVARRGSSAWTLTVTGREGHSSTVFSEAVGSGAIFEAARIVHRFYEEVRGPRSLTFNPGVILGGTEVEYDTDEKRGTAAGKTNVVAQAVVIEGDMRFLSPEELAEAREEMRAIVADNLPGTTATIAFVDKYPAMPPTEGNQRLLDLYSEVSEDLGYGPVDAYDPVSRGAADISFVAPDVDGIDGLGAWGEGAHSPQESLSLTSLVPAAQRAAVLLHRLGSVAPAGGDTLEFTVPPPDTLAPDLVSQILHHAQPNHPVCPGDPGAVRPATKTCFMLLYGWRGAEPADDVRISIGVPAGITLTGASRAPSSRSSAGWRWDLGTLEPGTFGSILVQADVGSALTEGATVRLDSYVQGDVENEAAENNGSWAVVRIGPP